MTITVLTSSATTPAATAAKTAATEKRILLICDFFCPKNGELKLEVGYLFLLLLLLDFLPEGKRVT